MKKRVLFVMLLFVSVTTYTMDNQRLVEEVCEDLLSARNSTQFLKAAFRLIDERARKNPMLGCGAITSVTELLGVLSDRNELETAARALYERMEQYKRIQYCQSIMR